MLTALKVWVGGLYVAREAAAGWRETECSILAEATLGNGASMPAHWTRIRDARLSPVCQRCARPATGLHASIGVHQSKKEALREIQSSLGFPYDASFGLAVVAHAADFGELEEVFFNYLVLSEQQEDAERQKIGKSYLGYFSSNLESLCAKCHKAAHMPRKKWVKLKRSARKLRKWRMLGRRHPRLCVPKEAVLWHRKAAEQGHANAQFNLGVMYGDGWCVPKDDREAALWYRKAAEQGHAGAQSNLGVMYRDGRGVPKDDGEAVLWYRKAAEQGHAGAQSNLGVMYGDGGGVPKDDGEAVLWYRKAAEQGHANAQFNLGVMYGDGRGVPKDDGEAVLWCRKAAEQGHATAQFNLGVMYGDGRGVPKDDGEAVLWYRKAAEQGYAIAQFNLGVIYMNGDGVPKDYVQAYAWANRAAAQGHISARELRTVLSGYMTWAQIAEAVNITRPLG